MTPLFAYHTDSTVVACGLRVLGFEDIHQVCAGEAPTSAGVVVRQDVGMRGHRPLQPADQAAAGGVERTPAARTRGPATFSPSRAFSPLEGGMGLEMAPIRRGRS